MDFQVLSFFNMFDIISLFWVKTILITAWFVMSYVTFRGYLSYSTSYFSQADQDCREFVDDNYENPPRLDKFKMPEISRPKALAIFSSIVGGLSLLFFHIETHVFWGHVALFGALIAAQKLTWFDQQHMLLPDDEVLRFGFFNLVIAYIIGSDLQMAVQTAVILGVGLGSLSWIFKQFGKDAIGFGDIKLLFVMVPWLNTSVFSLLFVASMLALFYYAGRKIVGKKIEGAFPFGPFLLLAWVLYTVKILFELY